MVTIAALVLASALGQAKPDTEQPATHGEDHYLAGESVDVTRDVPGDLVAAGGNVRVGASVAEMAILAGGNVAIDGRVGDDVVALGGEVVLRGRASDARLAGGNVRIVGRVDDDATAAGGKVHVERDAVIGGGARLAGGEIVVAGTVGRELHAAGGRVSIDGHVQGDVNVRADSLDIGRTARIDGAVLHHGPREPRIDAGARIAGRVEHRPSTEGVPTRVLAGLAWLVLLPALFVAGAVMILVFPRFTRAAAERIGTDPWRSLGVGALAFLAAPAAMVALFVTVIGIPLGLGLLAGFPVALLAGGLVGALFVGISGARRLRTRREPPPPSRGALVLRLLFGLVVLGILQLVPVLGDLVWLAALLFGMGALVVQLYRTYRGAGRAEPPASTAGNPAA